MNDEHQEGIVLKPKYDGAVKVKTEDLPVYKKWATRLGWLKEPYVPCPGPSVWMPRELKFETDGLMISLVHPLTAADEE
jgi:hypothetical protein